MTVAVMSRKDAINYCNETHDERSIMISISDPHMEYKSSPFCSAENNIIEILSLCFADADSPGYDVYGRKATVDDLMKDSDGLMIACFLEKYPVENIIVHCDAGISRSAGVAGAILKYYLGDDTLVFDDPHFYPNMWCYRKTLQALSKH